jgi:hypothetical protein
MTRHSYRLLPVLAFLALLAGWGIARAADAACVTQAPVLWARSTSAMDVRVPWVKYLRDQGIYPNDIGALRVGVGVGGCVEVLNNALTPSGVEWVPYGPEYLAIANKYALVGPGVGGGHGSDDGLSFIRWHFDVYGEQLVIGGRAETEYEFSSSKRVAVKRAWCALPAQQATTDPGERATCGLPPLEPPPSSTPTPSPPPPTPAPTLPAPTPVATPAPPVCVPCQACGSSTRVTVPPSLREFAAKLAAARGPLATWGSNRRENAALLVALFDALKGAAYVPSELSSGATCVTVAP